MHHHGKKMVLGKPTVTTKECMGSKQGHWKQDEASGPFATSNPFAHMKVFTVESRVRFNTFKNQSYTELFTDIIFQGDWVEFGYQN